MNSDDQLNMAEGLDLDSFGTYPYYNDQLKITQEDVDKVLTTEELTKLCLKRKCRVYISRWNPVEDWRNSFKESGRWNKWNDKVRFGMLAKAVKVKKETCLYKPDEIVRIRKMEWALRKKDNILDLRYWKHVEEREQAATSSQYRDSLVDEISIVEDVWVDNQLNSNNITESTENQDVSKDRSSEEIIVQPPQPINNDENLYLAVHTESMTIDSDIFSQSQNSVQPSQDVLPPDYNEFNTQMPSTSTQSQNVVFILESQNS